VDDVRKIYYWLFGRLLCVYCDRFAGSHLMCAKHRAIWGEEKDRSLKP